MGKPRKFSPDFKAHVMLEIVSGKKSLAATSREHQIKDTLLHRWKTQFLEGLPEIFAPGQPAEQKRLRTALPNWNAWQGSRLCNWKSQKKHRAT